MESYHEKVSKSVSFDRKNYTTVFIVVASILLLSGGAVAQVSSGYDVSIGQNGIEIGTGTLDVLGNDIESSGTTVFDGSAGQIATGVVDYTAATASDVGLGNVENIALSTVGGNDLTWNSGSSQLDVDSSSIQSGTTASDVGLGNVQNEAQVAESGDTMSGELLMNENIDFDIGKTIQWDNGNRAKITEQIGDLFIQANGIAYLESDSDSSSGGPYQCYVNESNGDWACDGSKSWIHDLGNGSEAFYTSQESPQVRAVYEGKKFVDGQTRVELPEHFSMTVSDSKPMLRSTATVQGKLAYAAVIEKTDDYIVLDSSEPSTVNYRITGIRDGYEDKQVVRPKEE